ncbi:MAG: flagellar protein [Lachnospiraceae bacterium]|nr:flagellar protein [Lachnospiraceae bacterium]
MDIRNCQICGSMFQYVGNKICPNCAKALENKLQEVKQYIDEHDRVTVMQVSEELDVPVKQIRRWIQEDRLMFAPGVDTGLVCNKCGMPIESGNMCAKCKESLKNAFAEASRQAQPRGVYQDKKNPTASMHLSKYK